MQTETRDMLLFAQLQEGLRFNIMESPAVSGATTYSALCLAAKNEEKRWLELKKRKSYNLEQRTQYKKPTFSSETNFPKKSLPEKTSEEASHGWKTPKCWTCGKVGHLSKDCRGRKKESPGSHGSNSKANAKIVQSEPVPTTREDPREFMLSDSEEEDKTVVSIVHVRDAGSKPQRAPVHVQGVPMPGVVDSGADITIIGGEMFKRVAAVAKLHKKDFKPPDKKPVNYDQKPFIIDGRVDLDVAFQGRSIRAPVYVKMDAAEQLLLSEGVCRQLGIVKYHQQVQPGNFEDKDAHEKPETRDCACQVPTVRVRLVQNVRIPPKHMVVAKVQLLGLTPTDSFLSPQMLEGDADLRQNRGIQISDCVIQPTSEGTARIILTNHLGVSQKLEKGLELGTGTDTADILTSGSALKDSENEESGWDLELATQVAENQVSTSQDSPSISQVQTEDREQWRRLRLRDALTVEFADLSIPTQEKELLYSAVEDFHDVFCLEDGERGETDLVTLNIDTGDARPKRLPVRRVPFAVREEILRQLQEMQANGVIEPSSSPWASPIVMVRKKDGTMRMCVDYRNLNSVTKSDVFPLPRIDDLLDQLAGSMFFSTLDLAAGYWQVKVDPDSIEKTAFITPRGLYQFRVMPFGLTNAPSIFQRLMQRVLSHLDDEEATFADVYIDDILLFSKTMEDHIRHLQRVFQRLREAGLKLKLSKCHFLRQSVDYLGYVITPCGLQPNQKQVAAVADFPVPVSVTAVRQFLGLTSYYRRFIHQFAKKAEPLHRLTRKDVEFTWDEDCQQAFELLKTTLVKAPILVYPNFERSFVVETDASICGLGAILSQEQSDGQLHPIAYGSRVLSVPQRNYGITELETLAVVWALTHFLAYVYGHEVTVVTDHSAVKSILEKPNLSGKHARWWLKVYGSGVKKIDIRYRPGRENAGADALSRNPVLCPESTLDEEFQVAAVSSSTRNLAS